ncbi:hypothetical protein D9M71_680780 [compost metagenome]
MHQQVVQAEEHRPQQQDHHQHPDQLAAVLAEEVGVGRALGEVDDAAEVAEHGHLDQRGDQADHQQGHEAGPHLAQVIQVERPHRARGGFARCLAENIDQSFETAVQHGRQHSCSSDLQAVSHPCEACGQSIRLADLI